MSAPIWPALTVKPDGDHRLIASAPSRAVTVARWLTLAGLLALSVGGWKLGLDAVDWLQWAAVAVPVLYFVARGARYRAVVERRAGLVLWRRREWWRSASGAVPIDDVTGFEVESDHQALVQNGSIRLVLVSSAGRIPLTEYVSKNQTDLDAAAEQLAAYCHQAQRVAQDEGQPSGDAARTVQRQRAT